MSDSINLLSSTPRFSPAQCYRILTAFLLLGRIIGGIAVITGTQQPVSPISPSSQDEKQRDGDEFSNNLVSDLSPLLALFGERFAQQFMSYSTTWLDSVIFAMAPLGIITAIVGAVRVGGPSWLKSLIGRVRETRAAAEVELMSSTSHEVCEIWNGDAIVRVMGAPDIEQFLFFNKLPAEFVRKGLPQSTEETTEGSSQETWRILTLKEATDIGLLERRKHGSLTEMSWRYTGSFVHRIFRKIAGLRAPTSGVREDDCGGAPPSATIIQTVEISPTAPLGVSSVFRRKRSSLADLERASTTSEGIKSLPLKAQESDELRLPSSDSEPEENGADNHNKAAPNISLNLGVMTKPWELYIAAVFGVFVQLGVLVIAGLATYHPRWKFRKQGLTVRDYAYPLCAVGILLQSAGMCICASVVEQSTHEDTWVKCKDAEDAEMTCFWLQKRGVINDQKFDSFAIFATGPADFVMTSHRQKPKDPALSYPTPVTCVVTVAGTIISIAGFVLNFIGLRGLHWSASMAQLAATGIMTLVRALIRRGISTKPYTRKLEEGFELNWLARALLKGPENFGPRPKKNAECTELVTQQLNQGTASTISAPGRAKTVYLESTLGVIAGGNPKLCVRNKSEKPMSLVKIRQNLGRLSQWRSLASEPAVTVANAIEVVMNTLFRFEDGITTFSWFMDVQLEGAGGKSQDSESHHEQVSLTVKKDNASKSWIAIPEEVEALLSLWFQHAHDAECNEKQLRINPTSASNDWLRRKPQKKNMRFLGPDTPALRRDLQWWLPDGVRSLLQVKNGTPLNEGRTLQAGSDPAHHVIDYHRITGFHAPEDLLKSPCSAIHFDCGPVPSDWLTATPHEKQQISTETLTAMVNSNEITCVPTAPEITTEKPSYGRKEDCTALGMVTGISRELLFAQHIFTAFMSEVATKIDRIRGESKANQRAMKNHPTAWQHFRLENTDVSTIALGVKDTGLGTFEEALLCIIPPLSLSNRLPVGAAVDLVLRNMEGDENVLNWEKSQEVYEELLNFGTRFHSASCLFTVRAAAAAVECVRRMQDMEELYADNSKDPDAERLQGAKEKILGGLRNLISDDVKKLLQELYKRQKREHEYRWFMRLQHESSETPKIPQMYGDSEDEASATGSSSIVISKETPGPAKGPATSSIEGETFLDGDDITKALGYSPLHSYIVSSVDNGMDDKLRRYVNEGDILAWRPLHYAVKELLNLGANPNEPDIFGFTPLHYAAAKGDSKVLDHLLVRGAQVDAHSRDGTTALHIAAKCGHRNAVKKLLDHKAQVDVQDSTKRTPLHWATYRRKHQVVESLLRSSSSTARVHDFQQKTALHLAASRGNVECAETLIDHSHREARDQAGMTALHLSAMKGFPKIVGLLLDHNSHGDATDSTGSTPLHLAVSRGHKSVVNRLLEHNAGVNTEVRDAKENTALHIATLACHQSIVELLLQHHADTGTVDGENRTALEVAAAAGSHEIVTILLQHLTIGDCIDDGEYRAFYTAAHNLEADQKLDETKHQNYSLICNLFLDREVDRGLESVMMNKIALTSNADTEKSSQKEDLAPGGLPRTGTGILNDHSATNICSKKTALHKAAEYGHDCMIKLLLERDVDKETQTATGSTALHLAATRGRTSVVQILLMQGANNSAKDSSGDTALHLAVKGNYSDVVRVLLKIGLPSERHEVNSEGADGHTPLSLAADKGYWKLCQLLLQHNADIKAKDRAGNMALHLATIKLYEDVVKCLVKHGAPLDAMNDSGQTPLSISISTGADSTERRQKVERWLSKTPDNANRPSLPITKFLLSKGAAVNTTDSRGNTELHIAAKVGQEEVVALLLKHGAAIDNSNLRGRRALHLAAKRGHKTIVQSLIDTKALLNAQDSKGMDTALHLALAGKHQEVVQLLLKYGAATDIENRHGECADLHFALISCKGGESVACTLIEHGTSINFTDDSGRTPLHTACDLGYISVVRLLLDRGADIDARDNNGNTALHIAVRGNREGVAEQLLQNGASIKTEDIYGRNPSVWAAVLGRRSMTKLMCAIAAIPSNGGRIYESALRISVLKHDIESVRQLLRSGGSPDASDEHGWTATLCATQSNTGRPILRLLESFQQPRPESQTLSPTSWSTSNKELNLQLRGELEACFISTGHKARAVVQANHPFPPIPDGCAIIAPDIGEYVGYFEIKGRDITGCRIVGLGLCNGPLLRFDRMPGCDLETWGYRGEDGKFESGGLPRDYSATYKTGDTIGCGVDYERQMFFTKNGKHLGIAFTNVFGQLFPIVGMASGGHIRANFAGPFQYSPDAGAPASKDKQMENMCVAKISKDLNGMMEKQNNEGDRQKNARDSLVGEGSEDEGDNASDVESNAAKRSQSPVSMFESDSN